MVSERPEEHNRRIKERGGGKEGLGKNMRRSSNTKDHLKPNAIEASYKIYTNGRNLNGVTKQ